MSPAAVNHRQWAEREARAAAVQFVRDHVRAWREASAAGRDISGADCVDYCEALYSTARDILKHLPE